MSTVWTRFRYKKVTALFIFLTGDKVFNIRFFCRFSRFLAQDCFELIDEIFYLLSFFLKIGKLFDEI